MTARTDYHARQGAIQTERAGRKAPEGPRAGRRAAKPVDAASVVTSAMSEAEFQRRVLQALSDRRWHAWHVPDSRRMAAGLPDVLAVHPGIPVMLCLELKGRRTPITDTQRLVIEILSRVPGVYARIVRPAEWQAVLEEIDGWRT